MPERIIQNNQVIKISKFSNICKLLMCTDLFVNTVQFFRLLFQNRSCSPTTNNIGPSLYDGHNLHDPNILDCAFVQNPATKNFFNMHFLQPTFLEPSSYSPITMFHSFMAGFLIWKGLLYMHKRHSFTLGGFINSYYLGVPIRFHHSTVRLIYCLIYCLNHPTSIILLMSKKLRFALLLYNCCYGLMHCY